MTAVLLCATLYLGQSIKAKDRSMLLAASTAVITYTSMRGVHMQFLLWIWFFLPYVLVRGAHLHPLIALRVLATLDWCHAWVANVIQPLYLLEAGRAVMEGHWRDALAAVRQAFGQLKSVSPDSGPNLVRMLGAYYETGFSIHVIPASFVLCVIMLFIAWRTLATFARTGSTDTQHID